MTLRAVIFDIGDTLWGLNPLPEDLHDRMAAALCEALEHEHPLAGDVVSRAMLAARAIADDGTQTEPSIAAQLQVAAREAELELTMEVARLAADVIGAEDILRFGPNPRLHEIFDALKASGLRVGLVSNTWSRGELLTGYLHDAGAGHHIDFAVFSGDEGIRKPHPEIYRKALTGLGIEADEAIFVGDRVREDILGPVSVGMRAVLTHEYRNEDPAGAQPIAVITRLEEMLRLTEAIRTASDE